MNKGVDDPVDYFLVGVLTTAITVGQKKRCLFGFFSTGDRIQRTHTLHWYPSSIRDQRMCLFLCRAYMVVLYFGFICRPQSECQYTTIDPREMYTLFPDGVVVPQRFKYKPAKLGPNTPGGPEMLEILYTSTMLWVLHCTGTGTPITRRRTLELLVRTWNNIYHVVISKGCTSIYDQLGWLGIMLRCNIPKVDMNLLIYF